MLKPLQKLLNDDQLTFIETLQELWSGYGKINRYYSPALTKSIIVKSVNPPQQVNHPRGWHSDAGHQRKLNSYRIEANFYQHYAHLCSQQCYVPQVLALAASKDISQANLKTDSRVTSQIKPQVNSQVNEDTQLLVMEDLQALGFNNNNESTLSLSDIKIVISWLANFHASFMGNEANGLWPVGTYWHLATRQNELTTMEDVDLKRAASFIDEQLNNATYQTIVHGDAKLANFCFGDFISNKCIKAAGKDNEADNKKSLNVKRVAAVDFQYVGKGVGVKDLAYFLGSCLTDNDLSELHDELLDYYFNALKKSCIEYQKDLNFSELEKEWRKLYSFANADFHRFLQGWSPEHYKINDYLQAQSDLALEYMTQHTSQRKAHQ